jgi:5-methylthioadenosine/S-adenosylhomocysteine deaminase
MHCDLIVEARWIVPVVPQGVVLEHHALAVKAGVIVAIKPIATMRVEHSAERTISLPEHALMPGLVNAHTHVAMSLMRGLADDLPLMTWLNDHIWPAENRWVSPEFVRDGAELAIAEMLRGGVTAFQDGYFHADVVAETAAKMGMRAITAAPVIEFPTGYAKTAAEYIEKAEAQIERFRDHPLVCVGYAPHAPYSVANASFERIAQGAERYNARIYCHVHETADEIDGSIEQFGVRPLQRLQDLGLLTPRLTAAHMTQLTDQEINLFAASGAHVAHCPESNLKLASGFCPVDQLLAAGVNVALGTDGAASNNDLDMLGEMKTAALLAKAVAKRAQALNAPQALEIATLGGAKALGWEQRIGSLEVGKQADFIALAFDELDSLPIYHIISQIVYTNHRRQVSHSWIAGQPRLADGVLVDVDTARIRANAWAWRDKIARSDALLS